MHFQCFLLDLCAVHIVHKHMEFDPWVAMSLSRRRFRPTTVVKTANVIIVVNPCASGNVLCFEYFCCVHSLQFLFSLGPALNL